MRNKNYEAELAQRQLHYAATDENDKLIINLRDLNHTMHFLWEGRGSQKRILIILGQVRAITQQELTRRLGIQPGSASEVLAKLEGAGLITRTPSQADRRTTTILLTPAGEQAAREATEQRNRRHEEMFSCLSEVDKATLLTLLETINRDWERRYRKNQEVQEEKGANELCGNI